MNPGDRTRLLVAGAMIMFLMALLMILLGGRADASNTRYANSTAYCLRGTMADGTYTRRRSIAMNGVRLGTKIKVTGRQAGPGGLRIFYVRDRIGHGSQLDFWVPSCGQAYAWGRRNVKWKVIK